MRRVEEEEEGVEEEEEAEICSCSRPGGIQRERLLQEAPPPPSKGLARLPQKDQLGVLKKIPRGLVGFSSFFQTYRSSWGAGGHH